MNDKATDTNPGPEVFELTPQVETLPTVNPMQMLGAAIERGIDADQLDKLMELQERYEKNEARKAYYAAVAAAAVNMPIVTKDKINLQYNSAYPSRENTINTISPHLAEFELSARWEIDQSAGIRVTCILSHVAGHSENVTLTGPPDTSGKKNELQQIKSTLTYLELASFEAITGTASMAGSFNDDGNAAGVPILTEKEKDTRAKRPMQKPATDKQRIKLQDHVDGGKISKRDIDYINKNLDTMTRSDATHILKIISDEQSEHSE
jgi:hypothetical protein